MYINYCCSYYTVTFSLGHVLQIKSIYDGNYYIWNYVMEIEEVVQVVLHLQP